MSEPPPPSPLSKTYYKYMVNSKTIQTRTYLKANRKIHGTLVTLPKLPPSFDGVDWLTVSKTHWPYSIKLLSNINNKKLMLFGVTAYSLH